MSDFTFLHNLLNKQWVISAPRRAKRPFAAGAPQGKSCPFCLAEPGLASQEQVLYSHEGVKVVANKFPFAPIHEVIIHSPHHEKTFGSFTDEEATALIATYRQRFRVHQDKGQVYIFHNKGKVGGESVPHPHSQLVVIPEDIPLQAPQLDRNDLADASYVLETHAYYLFCPQASQWPDEVWLATKQEHTTFAEANDEEVASLAHLLGKLFRVFSLRYQGEFPCNFYIYHGKDWYLRLIPRKKVLGGFEVGAGIFVNTQDPKETMHFLKEHLHEPDAEIIKTLHEAAYHERV